MNLSSGRGRVLIQISSGRGLRERSPRPQACHAYRLEHGEVAKHTYDPERARNPTVDAPMRRLARDVAAAKHDCAGCRHARRFTHVMARRIAQPPKATFVMRLRPQGRPGGPEARRACRPPPGGPWRWPPGAWPGRRSRRAPPWASSASGLGRPSSPFVIAGAARALGEEALAFETECYTSCGSTPARSPPSRRAILQVRRPVGRCPST